MNLERILVATGLLLLPALWLQGLLHQAPRFAGSLAGGLVGTAASVLMALPLAYALLKRLPKAYAGRAPASALPLHVWATTAGALLAIIHSGHRVQSWLGLLLVAAMLLALLSGYVGRHYLHYVSLELRERRAAAARLRIEYDELAARGAAAAGLQATAAASVQVADALAELEYAIRADEWIRDRLRLWLPLHVAASVVFYALLVAHLVSAVLYGARWLR